MSCTEREGDSVWKFPIHLDDDLMNLMHFVWYPYDKKNDGVLFSISFKFYPSLAEDIRQGTVKVQYHSWSVLLHDLSLKGYNSCDATHDRPDEQRKSEDPNEIA